VVVPVVILAARLVALEALDRREGRAEPLDDLGVGDDA